MESIINNVFDLFYSINSFLLKQTIYTFILFIIIFILAFLLRKKSPLWQLGLWTLILIRLILPADLSLPINIPEFADNIPVVNNMTSSIERIIRVPNNEQNNNPNTTSYNSISTYGTNLIIAEPNNIQRPDKFFSWSFLILISWITGCLVMTILIFRKWFLYHRIIKNSSLFYEDRIDSIVKHWQDRLKIKRDIKIISSDEFLSPFTTGIFKPVIYIPASLISSSDADLIHSIIAHEMVHIKRFDALWIKIQNILQIIHFFNPVVWYINRQINLAREQICDSTVLSEGNISSKIYGNSILHVLKHNLFGPDMPELLPCFGSHRTIFKQRIQNIIKGDTMKKHKHFLILVIICLIGLVMLPLVSSCNKEPEFEVPRNGTISSSLGLRKFNFTGEKEPPIRVANPGIVTGTREGTYGKLVIIKHNKFLYSTYYGTFDTILVKEGQTVKSGDTIATYGRIGAATRYYTRFEISKDGEPLNPELYLHKYDMPIQREMQLKKKEIKKRTKLLNGI